MLVTELVAQLGALWPFANDRQTATWAKQYRDALANYEGLPLQAAFDDLLAEWTKTSRPLPGDFVAKLKGSSSTPTKGVSPGTDHRKRGEEAQSWRPRLEAEWWQARGERVREIQAGLPEGDRGFFRFHVEHVVRQKAWLAALARADGNDGACVVLTEGDVKTCLQRVESQLRSKIGRGPMRSLGDAARSVVQGGLA